MKKALSNLVLGTILVLFLSSAYLILFTKNGQTNFWNVVSSVQAIGRSYPKDSTEPKQIRLTCNYHGNNLAVSETLYGNIAEYYRTDPKKRVAFNSDDNKAFVYSYPEDSTINDLAGKIEDIGTKNELNPDQELDLAACFLQSIPYDQAKATKILSNQAFPVNEIIQRYPYETLYDFEGICTDKSYLGAAIFRAMGYKVSLLDFKDDRHMSIGVGVPQDYGDFGTNYGIMELTGSGFLVGDIPNLNTSVGLAENAYSNLPEIKDNLIQSQSQAQKLSALSNVEVISDGKLYNRIVDRTLLKQKIDQLAGQIESQKNTIQQSQDQLTTAESSVKSAESLYKSTRSSSDYQSYLQIYNNYSALYQSASSQINTYNSLIRDYNNLVGQYKKY